MILCIGTTGCGKSSLLKLLQQKCQQEFVKATTGKDSDDVASAAQGTSKVCIALYCKIISEGKEDRGNSNEKLKFQGKGNKKDNTVKSPSPPEGYIPAMISTVGTDLITLPVKPSKGKAGGSNSGGGAPMPQEIVNIREVQSRISLCGRY